MVRSPLSCSISFGRAPGVMRRLNTETEAPRSRNRFTRPGPRLLVPPMIRTFMYTQFSNELMTARGRQSNPLHLRYRPKAEPWLAIHPSAATFLQACWHARKEQDMKPLIPHRPDWRRDTRVAIRR